MQLVYSVTYNEDLLLDADSPMGKLDILGSTLVDAYQDNIDFMSYQEPIVETKTYTETYLDSPGNVFGNYSSDLSDTFAVGINSRVSTYTDWYTSGIALTTAVTYDITGFTVLVDTTSTTYPAYFNIGNVRYSFSGNTLNLNPLVTNSATTPSRVDVLYLTPNNIDGVINQISVIYGIQSNLLTPTNPQFTASSDTIILGYVTIQYSGNTMDPIVTYTPSNLAYDGGYIPLSNINITEVTGTTNYLQLNFVGSSGTTDLTNYNQIRTRKTYDMLSEELSNNTGVIIELTGVTGIEGSKYYIVNPTIVTYTSTSDAYIRIYMGSETLSNYHNGSEFLLYFNDNEFLFATGQTISTLTSTVLPVETTHTAAIGMYSTFYQDYYNGIINTGDYFWQNNDSGTTNKAYLDMFFVGTLLTANLFAEYAKYFTIFIYY